MLVSRGLRGSGARGMSLSCHDRPQGRGLDLGCEVKPASKRVTPDFRCLVVAGGVEGVMSCRISSLLLGLVLDRLGRLGLGWCRR